ncbi:MAG: hypothetical protein RLO04_05850 [Limnobacter sp.]|uniref:hypothetical protein n=2 Tax=Limnobacter sp. TaxID=2003368 RepID=UPI0032EBA82F
MAVSGSSSASYSAELYRDLRNLSQQSQLGVSQSESDFSKLEDSGQLDALKEKYGDFSFNHLNINGDNTIDENDLSSSSDRRFVISGVRSSDRQSSGTTESDVSKPSKPSETSESSTSVQSGADVPRGGKSLTVDGKNVGFTQITNFQKRHDGMQDIRFPSGTDYLAVTVSHGNGSENSLQSRFQLETDKNLSVVGHTGGDDKVIFLVKVNGSNLSGAKLNYQGGSAQITAVETGGRSLSIAGGSGGTNNFGVPSGSYFGIGASDAGKTYGGVAFGAGTDDPVNFFTSGTHNDRGAYMHVKVS